MGDILAGLKVIDAASFLAGPGAATVMADHGADVIKVEPPAGDGYRGLAARYRTDYNWLLTSRNKRDIALDITAPAGREALLRLVDEADVLLVNFRDDQLARYGLKYDDLKARNPRLIYAHITGYGTRGPDRHRRAYDATAWWARSGIMDLLKPHGGAPTFPVGGVGDHASAMALFGGVMMALYRREKTGKGGYVSTSLAANGAWANGMHLQGAIAGYDLGAILDEKGYRSPFSMVYETRDNRFIILVIPDPDREWEAVCRALNREEWITDERFPDMKAIMGRRDEVRAMMAAVIGSRNLDDIVEALEAENVTHSVVERISEVIEDAHMIENDIIVRTCSDHPDYQWTVANPIKIDDEPMDAPRQAPETGEHSMEILAGAGYEASEIARLLEDGIVKQAPRQDE